MPTYGVGFRVFFLGTDILLHGYFFEFLCIFLVAVSLVVRMSLKYCTCQYVSDWTLTAAHFMTFFVIREITLLVTVSRLSFLGT